MSTLSNRACRRVRNVMFSPSSGHWASLLVVGLAVLASGSFPQRTFADMPTTTVTGWTCPTDKIQIWDGDTLIGCSDGIPSSRTGTGGGEPAPGGQGPVGSLSVPDMATIEHASNCVEANGGQPARLKEVFSDEFAKSIYAMTDSSRTVYFANSYQPGWEKFGVGTSDYGQSHLTGFEQLVWTMAHERLHQAGNWNQHDGNGEYYDTQAHKVIQSYWAHGNGANCKK